MFARLNVPDFAFGLFLIALGAIALLLASDLSFGTTASMGPGFVPRGLALIIIVYGVTMVARALLAGRMGIAGVELRPAVFIFSSVALYAIALKFLGLALTGVIVVICAGYAARDVRWRENVVFAVLLSAFAVALFVLALGLPMTIWPEW